MDPQLVIPVVAILGAFSVPLAWFYFDHRNRRDRARVVEKALETGQDPQAAIQALGKSGDGEERPDPRRRSFRRGFILMAIGGAFLLSHHFGYFDHDDHGGQVVGLMLTLLGVAFFLGDLLDRGAARRRD